MFFTLIAFIGDFSFAFGDTTALCLAAILMSMALRQK